MTVSLIHSKQASPAHPLNLHEISRNLNANPPYITLGWTPPAGVISYIFYINGVKVSNGWNPTQSKTNFRYVKGMKYGVAALTSLAQDEITAS